MRFRAFKAIMAAIVVTTASLSAHNAKAETTLKVPFSFTASGQAMPAGLYSVKEDTFHNLMILRNQKTSKRFECALRPGDAQANLVHVALTFETLGASHTLRSIQYGSKMSFRLDKNSERAGFEPAGLSQGR